MNNGHKAETGLAVAADRHSQRGVPTVAIPLHPAWHAFVRYCAELQYGDIERLRIQDGLPVLAEVTKKKVKFGP